MTPETLTQIAAEHHVELFPWQGGYLLFVNAHNMGRVTAEALATMTEDEFRAKCRQAANPPAAPRLHYIGLKTVARCKSAPYFVEETK